MDDRLINDIDKNSPRNTHNKLGKNSKKDKCLVLNDLLSSKPTTTTTTTMITKTNSSDQQISSTNVSCFSLLKQIFHQSSSNNINEIGETNMLTY